MYLNYKKKIVLQLSIKAGDNYLQNLPFEY